jgi:hypothetical protein
VLLALALAPALAAAKAKPKPKLGHTVLVSATDGHPTVKPPHKKGIKLTKKPVAVPVGSAVDATSGHVKLTSAKLYGGTQSGTFSQGAFVVTQRKSDGLTDLTLAGGNFSVCYAAAKGRKPVVGAANRRRRLFGSAHGRFRTRGRNSSATVRGTVWLTEDDCTGTVVRNMSPSKTSRIVTSTNELQFDLDPGQTATGYCNHFDIQPDSYCVMLLAQPADGLIGSGIITQVDRPDYAMCIRWPDASEHCFKFPFADRDAQGWRLSALACPVGAPGRYDVAWSFDFSDTQVNTFLYPNPLSLTEDVAGPPGDCLHKP